jgi:hypothetical protein
MTAALEVLMLRESAVSVALLGLALPASSHAQAALDADTREVIAYRLTTPTLQKVAAAHHELATAMKADPRVARLAKLRAEKKQLEAKEEPTEAESARLEALEAEIEAAEDSLPQLLDGAKSLSDLEANIGKVPQLAGALKNAGLAPREYGTFMLALVQASLVHGLQKSGTVKGIPPDLKDQVNLENVKFVAANEAEIGRLMAEVKTATGEQ